MTDQPGASRAAFGFIFAAVVLDMLALGIIIPVLPHLILEFEGNDAARAAMIVGVFGTAWALMQFLFSPVMGALSDRFGRRPVLLISIAGMGLDYILMALAPSLLWLFIGRILSGITSASFSTAGAYIADVTPPDKRAARFGMLGAAFGIGFIAGPALGGVLGEIDTRLPFWVAAGLCLANALYGLFVLPESLPKERRSPFSWRRASPLGSLKMLASMPMLAALGVILFLNALVHHVLPQTFVLYGDYRYGWSIATTGYVFALVGVCAMVVQGGLVGPVVRRLGEERTLLLGLAMGFVSFLIYGLAGVGTLFLIGVPVGALWGLAGPALQGLMTRQVGPTEQGRLQGVSSSIQGVAGLFGPLLFSQLFAAGLAKTGGVYLPGAAFLAAAALVGIGAALALRLVRRRSAAAVSSSGESG
jgi:MFS transporter, DHA1 family, tetracycline resistance protein